MNEKLVDVDSYRSYRSFPPNRIRDRYVIPGAPERYVTFHAASRLRMWRIHSENAHRYPSVLFQVYTDLR